MTDDLNAPLGWDPPEKPPGAHRIGARLALALGGLAAATLLGVLWKNAVVLETSPVVVSLIEPAPPPPLQPIAAPPAPIPALTPSLASPRAADEDTPALSFGVRVRRGQDAASIGPRVIHVEPAETGVRLPPAPDPRVTETTSPGPLPRLGREGLRPMDVYARPFVTSTALRPDAPKIALIVGGVGLSPQGTAAAMAMPEAVTLAFPPYPEDIVALAARARARGHETLLQAPMEPFDYPRNDPGPHTLVADRARNDNDDLHWLMSRFAGYAGIINYLGGRFMADDAALTHTLAEIASRGLYFIDDGEARQSRLTAIAPELSLPHAVVDQTIDAHALPQAIDAALVQLELRAREKGAAIGFVNAAPQALERIGRFLAGLEKRGVALAPVSAVLAPSVVTQASPNIAQQETRKTMDKKP
jgi:polysaccharide deacetylase 2 family uncharacterized protein YibQ